MSKYFVFLISIIWLTTARAQQAIPPAPASIIDPRTLGYPLLQKEKPEGLTRAQVQPTAIVGEDPRGKGLLIDLGDSSLFGTLYSGVYFFEPERNDYFIPRFREDSEIKKGKGVIEINRFVGPKSVTNVNNWKDEGIVAYRLNLYQVAGDSARELGFHDASVRFRYVDGHFQRGLSLTDGPQINRVTSDHPDWLVVAFETDQPARGWVEIRNGAAYPSAKIGRTHEVTVSGLKPATRYAYRVCAAAGGDTLRTPWFYFTSAPAKSESKIVFGYTGDGRAGDGGGEQNYLGVNLKTLQQIGAAMHRKGAKFMLFNGDMISGYTTYSEDFTIQFRAFKYALLGFWLQKPVYCSIGNHEALLHSFDDGSRWGLGMDKWPYETESVEATFGKEFVFPLNGPEAYPDMPTYKENVYSFTYGNVKVIVFNNNYWWTSHNHLPKIGGSPEGYILPNQMEWIRRQLDEAEEDPHIRHVLLMGHEPFFPNGGHVKDALWYKGDNRPRAYRAENGKVIPFEKGIIELRNDFFRMIAEHPKVAAVLSSDEHAYHRTLLNRKTPIGLFPEDDLNGNGILDDGSFSAMKDLPRPIWFIVSGGGGAPYYTQQKTPWSPFVKTFSSDFNYILFTSDGDRLSMQVFNLTGQLLDEDPDIRQINWNPKE
ncbi:MAG: hypothetical protein Kow0037_27770 [Calditrichia bacterium]